MTTRIIPISEITRRGIDATPSEVLLDAAYDSVDTDGDPRVLKAAMLVLWAEATDPGAGFTALELHADGHYVPTIRWAQELAEAVGNTLVINAAADLRRRLAAGEPTAELTRRLGR